MHTIKKYVNKLKSGIKNNLGKRTALTGMHSQLKGSITSERPS